LKVLCTYEFFVDICNFYWLALLDGPYGQFFCPGGYIYVLGLQILAINKLFFKINFKNLQPKIKSKV